MFPGMGACAPLLWGSPPGCQRALATAAALSLSVFALCFVCPCAGVIHPLRITFVATGLCRVPLCMASFFLCTSVLSLTLSAVCFPAWRKAYAWVGPSAFRIRFAQMC